MPSASQEEALFTAALNQRTLQERAAYLASACAGDEAMLRRLQELLKAHDDSIGPLDSLPSVCAPTVDQPLTEGPSDTIGRYLLREQIGEGGMGTVWLAEQREPVKRRVALKLIKPGMDSRQVLSRFEAERQALALMDHPNIAKVFDGGMTNEGRPYFVMEYVKGVPITEYCDNVCLPLQERLKLFIQVCQAVQHAHQKGIIHRDLKPPNILVCLYDDQPVPKVIDFGVAKAIGHPLTEQTLYTAHGVLVGTPLYMSPEQAEFNNLDIDTRSDIYSLGVILYELLTGSTPLEKGQFEAAAFQEILRMIKEVEPPKPSTKVSSSASLPGIAAQRAVEPAQLSRVVRGDLDWIVMKSLEKERSRRYETASGLASDIERHLHDEPVVACPPSLSYRLRKTALRHKTAAATAAAIALVLVLGLIGTTWQAIRATVAEHRAQQRETEAVENLERAQKAEQAFKESLWQSYLDQAQSRRFSGRMGRRFESLSAIQKAAKIRPSLELRNEAIACMALVDLRVAKEWDGGPDGVMETTQVSFDPKFELYARSDSIGNISVRRTADDRETMLLPGPGQPSGNLCFSPDSQLLLAAYAVDEDKVLCQPCLWDLVESKTILKVEPKVFRGAMDFSPDSRLIAIGYPDRSIRLFNTTTGEEVSRLQCSGVSTNVRFDPTGKRILVDIHSQNVIEILDLGMQNVLHRISVPMPMSSVWHPKGDLVAIGSGSKISLWSASTGNLEREWEGHPNSIVDILAFNHSGNLLASSSWAGQMALWDPYGGKKVLELSNHTSRGPRLQFSLDDKLLSHNIIQSKVQIWEIAQQKECQQFYGTGGYGAAFHPAGRVIAASDGKGIRLWDHTTAKPLAWWPCYGSAVKFHPDGDSVVYAGSGLTRRTIEMVETGFQHSWKLEPPEILWTASPNHFLDLSSDGSVLAVSNWSGGKGFVLNWDDPRRQIVLATHPRMSAIAISPDQRWIATGTFKGWGVKIWDAKTGKFLRELPDKLHNGRGLAFSPDGRWLVTGTTDEYRVWTVGDWKAVHSIQRDKSFIACPVAFSPDGKILAIGSSSTTLKFIDVTTWNEIATLVPPDQQPFEYLVFSRDGTCLAVSAHGVLQVWDLRAVRQKLATMGLDWDLPPYPEKVSPPETPPPLVVEFIDAESYRKRGFEQALAGKWREAHEEFRKARQLDIGNLSLWLFEAATMLTLNEQAGYQQLCGELLERFGSVTKPNHQHGIAYITTIGPDAVKPAEWRQIRLLAGRGVALAPTSSLHQERLGAVCYRSGDHQAAIENLNRAIQKGNWTAETWSPGADANGSAWTKLFQAMAHHQEGDSGEAQRWLRLGEEQVAKDARSGQPWYDRQIAHVLLAEARSVLKGAPLRRIAEAAIIKNLADITPTPLSFTSSRLGNHEILIADPGKTELINLTQHQSWDRAAVWSRDGKQLVFESSRAGNPDIFVMNSDGTGIRQLTTSPRPDRYPVWSPDGRQICFHRDTGQAEYGWDLFVINADGTGESNITKHPALDADAAWSPDGERIAFSSNRKEGWFLYTIKPDGSDLQLLSRSPTNGYVYPAWSPDSSRLAFAGTVGSRHEICVINADGTDETQLTQLGGLSTFAAWSPDGEYIAFLHHSDRMAPGVASLYVMCTDGSDVREIAPVESFIEGGRPSWKP